MWKKPAIYFSLGLSAGILLCLAWPRRSATAEAAKASAVLSSAGFSQIHGNAIPAAAPSVTQIFHDGPLADEAFWAALGKSPEERRAAFQRKTGEILSSPRLAMRRRWFMAMLENDFINRRLTASRRRLGVRWQRFGRHRSGDGFSN